MSLRILAALAAALVVSGTAAADGPVRKLLKRKPAVVVVAAPAVTQGAPPVAASRDRLKDYLLAEIARLHAAEKAGKLTPEQWDRLKALIELLLRLAPLFFDSP